MLTNEYSEPLSRAVSQTREQQTLTQNEVAARVGVDVRTILNIENGRGNPKLEVLYPLVRELHIDPQTIFYPDMVINTPGHNRLRYIIDGCTEQEAIALASAMEVMLKVMRNNNPAKLRT